MMECVVVCSNQGGVFEPLWPDPVGIPSAALNFAVKKLQTADFNRCGRSGSFKIILAHVEWGVWVIILFQKHEPNGGVCMLMGADLKEMMSDAIRFDWEESDACAHDELYAALLNDDKLFERVRFEMKNT